MRLREEGGFRQCTRPCRGPGLDGTNQNLAVRSEVEDVSLCVLLWMELREPLEEWKDLRHVLRPRGDVHLTVPLDHAVEMPLSSMSKFYMKKRPSGAVGWRSRQACLLEVVTLVGQEHGLHGVHLRPRARVPKKISPPTAGFSTFHRVQFAKRGSEEDALFVHGKEIREEREVGRVSRDGGAEVSRGCRKRWRSRHALQLVSDGGREGTEESHGERGVDCKVSIR